MPNPNRRAGTIFFKVDGTQYDAKGAFTYDLGAPKRDPLVGHDGVHGYKELPKVPYIQGEITDRADLDVRKFHELDDTTVTLELANGKTIVLRNAWYAGDGTGSTEDGNLAVRFEGLGAEEMS